MSEAAEKLIYSPESMGIVSPPISNSDYQEDTWDTTVTYTSQTENSIGEDTPRDSRTSEILYKGAVEDTTVTLTGQRENSLGEDTPRDSQAPEETYRGTVEDTVVPQMNQLGSTSIHPLLQYTGFLIIVKKQITTLRDLQRKIDKEYRNSMKKKDREIEVLDSRIMNGRSELTGTKQELNSYLAELKESRLQIGGLIQKNAELDKEVAGLKKEINALKNLPVAEHEELGPQKEVEEVELKDSTLESTHSEFHTTTGGIAGDSEGDLDSFSVPGILPKKGTKRKEESGEYKRKTYEHSGGSSEESQHPDQDRKETYRKKRMSKPMQMEDRPTEKEMNLERLLTEQKRTYEEKVKELRREFEEKTKRIPEDRIVHQEERAHGMMTPPQERGEKSSILVEITEEN